MIDPPLPHNAEAERATLGAVFLDRDAIIPIAPWLRPDQFYHPKHAWVFEAQLACYARREPPDLQTVAEALRRQHRLEEIGGMPFLMGLANDVPSAFHAEYYGRIVERAAVRRRLIQAGGAITALGFDETDDVERTLDAAEQAVFAVSQQRNVRSSVRIGEVCEHYYDYLTRVQRDPGSVSGLPTGLLDLDRLTGGLHATDLLILAARPGVGKSALALTIAFQIARRERRAVGIFSLEMGREQLLQRVLAMSTGIDSQRLRTGRLTTTEITTVIDAMERIQALPIVIDDAAGLTVADLRAKARRMQADHGLDLLIVDYLQLMRGSGQHENRVQEVSDISRGLKQLAKELSIPVLALSQLSRAVEGRTSHVPVLADLRESGALEQDADLVLFIYRDELYDKDSDKKGLAELHIAKHRNGPLGVVTLFFDQRTTRFRDLAPYHAPDGV